MSSANSGDLALTTNSVLPSPGAASEMECVHTILLEKTFVVLDLDLLGDFPSDLLKFRDVGH